MSGLDIFALFVLLVLIAAIVFGWALLGMMPGKIARKRNHPQAEAISVCGWWGVITMGILCPLAFIWAYTTPKGMPQPSEQTAGESRADEEEAES